MFDQYCVHEYRIDLCFPAGKLSMECDDFGHDDRDIWYEVKQQKDKEFKLGYPNIRYNLNRKYFSIFKVNNQFHQFIQYKVRESYHRVILPT